MPQISKPPVYTLGEMEMPRRESRPGSYTRQIDDMSDSGISGMTADHDNYPNGQNEAEKLNICNTHPHSIPASRSSTFNRSDCLSMRTKRDECSGRLWQPPGDDSDSSLRLPSPDSHPQVSPAGGVYEHQQQALELIYAGDSAPSRSPARQNVLCNPSCPQPKATPFVERRRWRRLRYALGLYRRPSRMVRTEAGAEHKITQLTDDEGFTGCFSSFTIRKRLKILSRWWIGKRKIKGSDIWGPGLSASSCSRTSSTSQYSRREQEMAEPETRASVTARSHASHPASTRSDTQKHHLSIRFSAALLTAPDPFQCTVCLAQFPTESLWLQHEQRSHFENSGSDSEEGGGLYNFPNETTVSRFSERPTCCASRHTEPDDQLYWNCGFCDMLLCSWDQRQRHLASAHFRKGETMLLWDPLVSPFPWRKGSTSPALPRYMSSLRSLQRPMPIEIIRRVGDDGKQKHSCDICQITHPNPQSSLRHINIWHDRRSVWSCPTINDTTNLTDYFEEVNEEDGTVVDVCYLCADEFARPDYLDRQTRMDHLAIFHGFDECVCSDPCPNKEQFFLHLASYHNIYIRNIRAFMEDFCQHEWKPLVLLPEQARRGDASPASVAQPP